MSGTETPEFFAAVAEAARVEWALKCEVSIPASFKVYNNQRAIVADDTGLWGFWKDKNSLVLLFSFRIPSVLPSYSFNVRTGQSEHWVSDFFWGTRLPCWKHKLDPIW